MSQFIDIVSKSTILFDETSNHRPSLFDNIHHLFEYHSLIFSSVGSIKLKSPNKGNSEMDTMVGVSPTQSIIDPSATEPIPPIPTATPTINPDTIPILPGINSRAHTTATEQLDITRTPS